MSDWWDDAVQSAQGEINTATGQKQENTSNNPLDQAWNLATSAYKGYVVGAVGGVAGIAGYKAFNDVANDSPDVAQPTTKQPTLADANTVAINKQLGNERTAASASSILTGGAGLLDAPTTSSRTLLGS